MLANHNACNVLILSEKAFASQQAGMLFILGFAQPDVNYTECSVCSPDACEKNASCYSGGTLTHDLLLSDVCTRKQEVVGSSPI